jgi:hypothetical protein
LRTEQFRSEKGGLVIRKTDAGDRTAAYTIATEAGARAAPAVVDSPRRVGGRLRLIWLSDELLWVLCAAGAAIRLLVYLEDRSLWFDESALALNVIRRSFGGLLSRLDFGQAAPPGFLLVERGAADIFGDSELALRLFPLVSGVCAIFAFAMLARQVLTRVTVPLAVGVFALAPGPIYYSSELKPYSVDLAVAVILTLVGLRLIEARLAPRSAVALALASVATIAFSFAGAIVLAAVAIALAATAAIRRRLSPALAVVLGIWIAAAAAAAGFALTRLESIREGFVKAGDATVGFNSVFSLHGLNAIASQLGASIGLFHAPPWDQLQKVAAVVAAIGAISLIRRTRELALVVLLPLPIAIAAAAAGQYPLASRTSLFLVPGVALMLAEGVGRLSSWLPRGWTGVAGVAAALAVILGPVWYAAKIVAQPPRHEEIKPVLAYIRDHWRDGDTLYLHYEAQYAFLYYSRCRCISTDGPNGKKLWPVDVGAGRGTVTRAVLPKSKSVLVGPSDEAREIGDLSRLRSRSRVWFVYTHVHGAEEKFIKGRILVRLAELGTRIAEVDEHGAHAYLYTVDSLKR